MDENASGGRQRQGYQYRWIYAGAAGTRIHESPDVDGGWNGQAGVLKGLSPLFAYTNERVEDRAGRADAEREMRHLGWR